MSIILTSQIRNNIKYAVLNVQRARMCACVCVCARQVCTCTTPSVWLWSMIWDFDKFYKVLLRESRSLFFFGGGGGGGGGGGPPNQKSHSFWQSSQYFQKRVIVFYFTCDFRTDRIIRTGVTVRSVLYNTKTAERQERGDRAHTHLS